MAAASREEMTALVEGLDTRLSRIETMQDEQLKLLREMAEERATVRQHIDETGKRVGRLEGLATAGTLGAVGLVCSYVWEKVTKP